MAFGWILGLSFSMFRNKLVGKLVEIKLLQVNRFGLVVVIRKIKDKKRHLPKLPNFLHQMVFLLQLAFDPLLTQATRLQTRTHLSCLISCRVENTLELDNYNKFFPQNVCILFISIYTNEFMGSKMLSS